MLSKKKKIKRKIVASVCSATMLTGFFAPGVLYTRDSKADTTTYTDFNHNLVDNSASAWSGDGASYSVGTFVYSSANSRPGYGEHGGALMGTEFGFSDPKLISAIDNTNCSVPYFSSYSGTYTNSSSSPITMTVNIYFVADAADLYTAETPSVTNSIELEGASGNFTLRGQTDNIPSGTRYVRIDLIASYPELTAEESCQVVVNNFLNIVQDTETPVITAEASPSEWTNSPITVTVSELSDDIGVYAIYDSEGNLHEGNEYQFTVDEEGTHSYSFYAVDYAGNRSATVSLDVNSYDATAPDAPVIASVSSTEWTNVTPTITFEDFGTYSGSPWSLATVDGTNNVTFSGNTYTVTEEGEKTYTFVTVDAAGNVSSTVTQTVKYDKTAPVWTIDADSVVDQGDGTNLVTVNPTDALSGIQSIKYTVGQNVTVDSAATWTDITADGSFTASSKSGYTVMITDNAGNVSYYNVSTSFAPVIDQVAPQDFDEDYGTGSVAINVRDDSELADLTINYILSTGLEDVFEGTPTISIENGTVYFNFTLKDDANTANLTNPGITITVTDDDESPNTSEMTFDFVVNPINDAPVAHDINETTAEGVAVTIDVINNATDKPTDADGDTLTLTNDFTQPANGTVTIEDGKFVFTPTNPLWYGTTSFTYTVTDGNADAATNTSNTATIYITVTDDPSSPIARADAVEMDEDTEDTADITYIDVLANDSDADVFEGSDDYLTITDVTGATLGTATIDTASGKIHYVPLEDAYGTDTLTYTIVDTQGNEASAQIIITINPVNDAPEIIGAPESITINENIGETGYEGGNVGFSIDDPDNTNSEIMIVVTSSNQDVINSRNITVTRTGDDVNVNFIPALNTGDQEVKLTIKVTDGVAVTEQEVTVIINNINVAPVATDDDLTMDEAWKVYEGVQANVPASSLLINDTDQDNDTLTISSVNVPEGAPYTVVIDGDSLKITGAEQAHGDFTFEYVVSDGELTDTASVTFRIIETYDPPVIEIAADNSYECDEWTGREENGENPSIVINFTVSDADTDISDLVISAPYTNSTLISDVEITGPDSDGNCTLTITPEMHEYGTSAITIKVSDGYTTTVEVHTITVNNIQDPPVAVDDTAETGHGYTAEAGVAINILPSENDYDYDKGQVPAIVSFTQPAHGVVAWDASHTTLTYTADINYSGIDSFTYKIQDPQVPGYTSEATVEVNVTPSTSTLIRVDAPEFIAYARDQEDQGFDFSVASLAPNATIESITVTSLNGLVDNISYSNTEGTDYHASFDTGSITGYDYLTITATDSLGNPVVRTVKIFVYRDVYIPHSDAVVIETTEGTTQLIIYTDEIENFPTDGHGNPLSLTGVVPLSINNGSSVTVKKINNREAIVINQYDANFFGDIVLNYQVTDGVSSSIEKTITVRYINVPDKPIGRGHYLEVENEIGETGHITVATLLANDYDHDNGYTSWNIEENQVRETLSVLVDNIEQPAYGEVTYNPDTQTFTYTRTSVAPGEIGSDSFYYYITDGTLTSNKIKVTIAIPYDYLHNNEGYDRVIKENSSGIELTASCSRPSYCSDPDYTLDGNMPGNMTITYTSSNPSLGTIVRNDSKQTYNRGYFTFVPNPYLNGTTTITATFTVSYYNDDGEVVRTRTATQRINVSVQPVNDAPEFITSECGVVVPEGTNNVSNISGSGTTWTINEAGQMVFDLYYEDVDHTDSDLAFTVSVTNEDSTRPVVQATDFVFDRISEETSIVDSTNYHTVDISGVGENPVQTSVQQVEPGHIQATVTYIENSYGPITVTFTVSDGSLKDTIVYNVDVLEVDNAPEVQDISGTIKEDGIYNCYISNYVTDVDTDWSDLEIAVTQPADGLGTVSYDPDTACLTYTPTANLCCGQESADGCTDCVTFTYRAYTAGHADDPYEECSEGTITVHIVPVNDDPFLYNVPPYIITNEDEDVTFTFDAFDIEGLGSEGASVDVTVTGDNEAIINNTTGISITPPTGDSTEYTVKLSPVDNANGTLTITITVTDNDGVAKTAEVAVIVSSVNDAPVATDDSLTVNEINSVNRTANESYDVNILLNDSDVETPNANLRISEISNPANGRVVNRGNGVIRYIPNSDFNGSDSFTYTIKDGNGATATATVNVTVNAVNTPPTAADSTLNVVEGNEVSIDLTTLVTDVEIDRNESGSYSFTFEYTPADPENPAGTVSLSADGKTLVYNADQQIAEDKVETITYTVSDGEEGTATGTITVNVTAVSNPPVIVAVPDNVTDSYTWTMYEDNLNDSGRFEITLSDPDTSLSNLMFVYSLENNDGLVRNTDITVTTTETGKQLYIRTLPDQFGEFNIIATVSDNASSRQVTIKVIVLPVNDIPVADDQEITTDEDTSYDGQLEATDVEDGTDLSYAVVTNPEHGSVTVNADGTFTYEPAANYHGTDSFTFTATDSNTPTAGVSAPATVSVTVKPVNDNPVASDFDVTVDEKIDDTYTPNLIDVLAHVTDNDIVTDGEVITITGVTTPDHGTATIVTGEDGKQYISYVPELYNNYDVTITYTVEDESGVSASADVNITVNQVDTIPGHNGQGNDGTPANPKWTISEEAGATSLNVLANDDVDSLTSLNEAADIQTLTIDRVVSITTGAGTATVVNNKIQYTPATDFYTTAGNPVAIVYEMHDNADPDRKVQFTAYVAVRNVNDAPSIEDIADVDEQEDCDPFDVTVVVSDVYNETPTNSLVVTETHTNNTLINNISITRNADGTLTLTTTVNANAYGVSEVTVRVQDLGLNDSGANKLSDETTFEIVIYPVDDMPDPQDDTVYIDENGENPGSTANTPYIVTTGGIIVDVINNDDVDLRYEGDDNVNIVAGSLVASTNNPANNHSVTIVPNQTFVERRYNSEGVLEDYNVTRSGIQVIPDANWTSSVPVTYEYTYRVQDTIVNSETGVSSVEYKTGTFYVTINPVNDEPTITINQTVTSIYEDALGDLGDGWTTIGTITVGDEETAVSTLKDNTIVDWTLYEESTTYTPLIKIFDNDDSGVRVVNDGGILKIQVHPHQDENGDVTLGFTVTDDDATNPLSASATINLEVIPVQDDPANGDDFLEVAENSTTLIDVTANDDVDIATQGQSVTIIGVTQPATGRGTVSIVNNKIKYEADPNFYCVGTLDEDGVYSDAVTFTYTAQDMVGATAEFTVTINVTPVNDPPVITEIYGKSHSTTLSTGECQDYEYVYVVVEDPDTPWDQITLSYTSSARVVNVRQGGITQNDVAKGADDNSEDASTDTSTEVNQAIFTLLVHPNGKFNGTTTLTFTADDHESSNHLSQSVQTPFVVTFVNDPPVAVADNFTNAAYNEGTTITGLNVIANDEDDDLSTNQDLEDLTILADSVVFVDPNQADIGTFTIESGSKTLKFTPNADHLDWHGTISFKYTVVDHDGATSQSDVCTLVINPVNDAPVAWNGYEATVSERCSDTGSVSVNIMWHNYDVDDDSTRYGVNPANTATSIRLWPATIADENMNETSGYSDAITFVGFNGDNFKDGTNTSTITFDTETGVATYTPALHFNGDDVVTFTIKDSTGATSVGTVTFHVTAVRDNPDAVDDDVEAFEDDSVVISVLANDIDIDSNTTLNGDLTERNDNTRTVSLPTTASATDVLPAHGTVTTNGTTITYTPFADYYGDDTFTYTITNMDGNTDTATVTVTVNPVNDVPTADDETVDTDTNDDVLAEDSGVGASIDLATIVHDVDRDGSTTAVNTNETLTYTYEVVTASNVTGEDWSSWVSLTGSVLSFTPGDDFNGEFKVRYTVTDAEGESATAVVTFVVTAVEDDPDATDDTASVNEDESVVISVLANDVDIDSDTNLNRDTNEINDNTRTVSLPTTASATDVLPAHGTVTTNGTTITYTPFDDYYGDDTFTYTITNMDGNTDTATVTVTVNPVNDAPTAEDATVDTDTNNDVLTEDSGVGASIDLATIVHDVDRDGSSTAVNTNETLTYTYEVVTASNVTGEDWSSWVSFTGSVLSFTPGDDFNGEFKVRYTVTDAEGESATAVVTFVVTAVEDDPDATDDTASVDEGESVTINVLDNDIDIDSNANLNRDLTERNDNTRTVSLPTTASATDVLPAHGTVTTNGTTITYTPFDDYYGDDTFTYTITNMDGRTDTATVNVTVGPVNDVPTADDATVDTDTNNDVLAEDSGVGASIDLATIVHDVDRDGSTTAVNTNETLTYTYEVVTASNVTGEDWSSWVSLTGSVLSFTPGDDFNGEFKVEYTVTDAAGESATAVVTFLVAAVEDAPDASDDDTDVNEDEYVVINVLDNDIDIDSDTNLNRDTDEINDNTRTVSLPTTASATDVLPAHGTVTTNGTTITYTPFADYYGDDTFTYTITNMDGNTDTATVTVTVNPVNDAPTADDETVDTDTNDDVLAEDSGVGASIDLATIVHDVDRDGSSTAVNTNETLTYTYEVVTASNVTGEDWSSWVSLTGSVLSFTPGDNFNGEFKVRYTVTDAEGESATAVVTFVVTAVEDDPDATDDTASVNEDESVVISVLANDVDIDSDTNLNRDTNEINDNTRTVSLPTTASATDVLPAHGTVTTNGTTITYTPFDDYYGDDTFTYTITNMDGNTDTATVTVTVNPVNDAPTAEDATVDTDTNNDVLTEDSGVGASIDLATIVHDVDRDGSSTAVNTNETLTYSIRVITTPGMQRSDWSSWASLTGSVLSFTPGDDFNGEFKVEYTVTDAEGESATAVVTFVVTAVEDDPVATDDTDSVDEDDSVIITVLDNDSDETDSSTVWNLDENERNDYSLTVSSTLVTAPSHGTATVNNDGTITYTPDADFNGEDSFEYKITNMDGNSDTATVTVTVNPVADNPTAADDTDSVDEDDSVTIDVIANDSDTDSRTDINLDSTAINTGVLTVTSVTTPAHGSASIVDNKILYTPDDDFNGEDSFTYTVANSDGLTDTATVTVTVNPVEDDPEAVNDIVTVIEDTPKNIYAAANDVDVDSDTSLNLNSSAINDGTLVISEIVTGPTHGSASIDTATNSIIYTPDNDYNGPDTITYKVTNMDNRESNVAIISINVTAVADEPECTDDVATVNEDDSVSIDVVANDINIDGDGNVNAGDTSHTSDLTITAVTNGTYGTVTIDTANNEVVYTPNANFNGTDSFTYTVTNDENLTATGTVNVTVNPVEDNPTAVNDSRSTNEDESFTIDPTTNDSDIDSDTSLNLNLTEINDGSLTVISVGTPSHGTVSRTGNDITYTPAANYNGPDSFTYTIENMDGNTATATVNVNVVAQPDAPTARDDNDSVNEDEYVIIDVVNNDYNTDSDVALNLDSIQTSTLTITAVGTAEHGGTVTITVDNQIKYTPVANYNGTDRFTYTITNDENLTATATVYITVVPVEDNPTAEDDTATVDEDSTVEINVTENDSDIDSDTSLNLNDAERNDNRRVITSITVPAQHGTAEIDTVHNTIHYTPVADFNGEDSFEYEITNQDGNTDTAEVVVTVNPVEDNPVATGDSVSTPEDEAVTFDVRDNDEDIDSDTSLNLNSTAINTNPLVVTIVDDVEHGELEILADGTQKYTPDDNFNGTDTFTYYVTNEDGLTSETVTVTITVVPVEDNPTAEDDTATVDEDSSVVIDVTENDSDIDSDTELNLNSDEINDNSRVVTTITVPAQHGVAEIDPDNNTVIYTPDENFNGEDSFEYEITNMDGNTDTAVVVVTVVPVDDNPTAEDDDAIVDEDDSVEIDVVANDSDIDSDPVLNLDINEINDGSITIVSVTQPEHGTAEITVYNTVVYTPDHDFNGHDSFEYTIANADGNESTATVNVTINQVNDNPVSVDYMASTLEDYPITIKPLTGCSDVDYDPDLNETPDEYALEVVPDSFAGNMEGSSIEYDPATDRLTYTPAPGYVGTDSFTYTIIDNMGGESTSTITITILASDYTIVIDRDVVDFDDVTAEYEEAPAPEVLTITNLGNKPVTPSIPEIDNYIIVGDVPANLWPGESFTVTVQPVTGLAPECYNATFVVTTEEGTEDSCELEFNVLDLYFIEAVVPEGGTINQDTHVEVSGGATITYIFTPDEGYVIEDVLIDGVSVGAVDRYTFADILASHTVEVLWAYRPTATPTPPAPARTGEEASINVIRGIAAIVVGGACLGAYGFIRRKKSSGDSEDEE